MTLLLLPVRPGESNEELRYSLRSWDQNLLLPDLELWTVGDCPSWVVPHRHIEGNRHRSTPLAVFDNIRLISEAARDHETAIYMNDDFFCVKPVTEIKPVRRNLTLAEHIEMFPLGAGLWWPASLRLTASWLAGAGFPHPDSYEVHRPLLASPAGMYEALSQFGDDYTAGVPQWRTLYGNLYQVEAEPVEDVKLPRSNPVDSEWISTSDYAWRRYSQSITRSFQKPSRWEK